MYIPVAQLLYLRSRDHRGRREEKNGKRSGDRKFAVGPCLLDMEEAIPMTSYQPDCLNIT